MSVRDEDGWAPSDKLSQLFFQGQYSALVDSAMPSRNGDTHPAVIGALAMVGRLEEALAIAALETSGRDVERHAMVQFVLCMGQCHAGRLEQAVDTAERLESQVKDTDLASFFAKQGMAMTRYFKGAMREAKEPALAALAYAWRTGVEYTRVLALELVGHLAVQTGDVHQGLRTLEDAHALALSLGYTANAHTIRLSTLTYELRTESKRRDALSELNALIDGNVISPFARRNGLLSLALDHAVAGRMTDAQEHWAQANLLAQRNQDLRGNERGMITQAVLLSLSGDFGRAAELWTRVESNTRDEVRSFVECCYWLALLGRDVDRDELTKVEERTGMQRARTALELNDGVQSEASEDWPAIALSATQTTTIDHLVAHDALGLLPRREGLVPGKRIFVGLSVWVVEDHGNVIAVEQPIGNANLLLLELARGSRSKCDIFQAIWKQSYKPHLHDASLQKLVSRCRKILAERGQWIVSTSDGYQFEEGIEVVILGDFRGAVEIPTGEACKEPLNQATRVMRSLGVFTSQELSTKLRVSKATAVRLIRQEMAEGRLLKEGIGKATAYRSAGATSEDSQG